MKLTNKQMVLEALQRISMINKNIENVDIAIRMVNHRTRDTVSCGDLRRKLIDMELEEWRAVAMWGLTLDDKERDRIKAAVYERFLSDGIHVSKWWNNGIDPSTWSVATEEEFREMAKKAFYPKD